MVLLIPMKIQWHKCYSYGEPPVNDVHDYQKPSNWQDRTSRTIPKLGSDLNGGTLHTIAMRVFLKIRVPNATLGPSEGPMNIIKSKL